MGDVTGSDSITINAPLGDVLAVVRDVAGQVDWFPGTVSAEVLEEYEDGTPARARMVNDLKLAKDEFELDYEHDEASMSWALVAPSSAQKSASGSWQLEAAGAGTKATLSLAIDPSLPLPSFMVKKAMKDTIKGALTGLKRRCES